MIFWSIEKRGADRKCMLRRELLRLSARCASATGRSSLFLQTGQLVDDCFAYGLCGTSHYAYETVLSSFREILAQSRAAV